MANRTKVTQQKRARERAKQERQQEKTRRREEAKMRKANEPQQAGATRIQTLRESFPDRSRSPGAMTISPTPEGQAGEVRRAGWQAESRQPVDSRTAAGTKSALQAETANRSGGDRNVTPRACCLLPVAIGSRFNSCRINRPHRYA